MRYSSDVAFIKAVKTTQGRKGSRPRCKTRAARIQNGRAALFYANASLSAVALASPKP
jgi:hypothetical protein